MMYKISMADPDMQDALHLFQSRGRGTADLCRMARPAVPAGKIKLRTIADGKPGGPYKHEIAATLGAPGDAHTRDVAESA